MNTKEVAALAGVSVRTLHHYDKIGLLSPGRNPENGYRSYSREDLDLLQQILFFRECGFTLESIQGLLKSPSYDRQQAFELQRKYLLHERKRISAMLDTLEKTMKTLKGEIVMTNEEIFGGFDLSKNPYEEEARQLWGDEAVNESKARVAAMSGEAQKAVSKGMDDLFTALAALRTKAPDSREAQEAMAHMYRHFNQNFGTYSPEAFAGMGKLYVDDPRFTETIDRYGAGLSKFLAEAMGIYAENKK